MEIVLGVSMTPTAVAMALVEGAGGDGVTVDTDLFEVDPVNGGDLPGQVVAAILGTRESAVEGGHRLVCTGIAWTDHGDAARLRAALRRAGLDDAVMVSELHAASALAQAIGRKTDCDRTALLFCEPDAATVAVVRTADGAVVSVQRRSADAAADMVADAEGSAEPPQAVFVIGSGVEVAEISARVAERTALPVHAPEDAELALARGAALAAAAAPRYDAETVGLGEFWDSLTAAGPTQLSAAGSLPLGYSAVDDAADDLYAESELSEEAPGEGAVAADRSPFLLVGTALASVFVLGVAALVVSLAVSIRPTADERPDPGVSGPVPSGLVIEGDTAAPGSPAPETIPAPLPVVQQAPQRVALPAPSAPSAPVALPAPAVQPAPAALPAPPPAAPVPAPAPPPVVPAPAPAPAPVVAPVLPPIVISPVLPPLLPSILQPPVRTTTTPRTPSAVVSSPSVSTPPASEGEGPSAVTPAATPVVTSLPTPAPVDTTTESRSVPDPVVPDSGSSASSGSGAPSSTSEWPLWPFGG